MDWNDVLTLANTSETIAVYGIGAYLFLSRAIGAWRQRGALTVHPEHVVRPHDDVVSVTTRGQGVQWVGYGEREPE